jgi:hypothetical protein
MITSIVASALFAGVFAILITVAIEHYGGIVGGFLGTIPTTIIPASMGIASQSENITLFQTAMEITPVGMLLNAIFLLMWRIIPPYLPLKQVRTRLWVMTLITLSIWTLMAVSTVFAMESIIRTGFSGRLVGYGATGLILIIGLLACLKNPPAPKGSQPVNLKILLARGGLAATAIGLCVAISGSGDTQSSLLSGIVSVFPAIFLTAMVSVWWSQGETVVTGAIGPMMLGSGSVAVYALWITHVGPALGMAMGAFFSWLLAISMVTLPATLWLKGRVEKRCHDTV